jgi:hypothetical protein
MYFLPDSCLLDFAPFKNVETSSNNLSELDVFNIIESDNFFNSFSSSSVKSLLVLIIIGTLISFSLRYLQIE